MERKRILQRCEEGRDRAKAEGRNLGRVPNEALHQRIHELAEQGMNKHAISKELGCSRTAVYRVLENEYSNLVCCITIIVLVTNFYVLLPISSFFLFLFYFSRGNHSYYYLDLS